MRVLSVGLARLVRETLEACLVERGHEVVTLQETLDVATATESELPPRATTVVLLGPKVTAEELRVLAGLQSRAPGVSVLATDPGWAAPAAAPRIDAWLDEDLGVDGLDRAVRGGWRGSRTPARRHSWTPDDELTPRERQVARLLVGGRSSSQIAGELDLSVSTVHAHVQSLMRKLGARDRLEAVHRYLAARSPLDLWSA
jgi:DNA-binding NarL/FixJ family response regulator